MSNNNISNNKRTRSTFEESDIGSTSNMGAESVPNVGRSADSDVEEDIVYKPVFVVHRSLPKYNSDGLSRSTENVETKLKELTPAERMYAKHLSNVKKYQQKNPEKMKVKSKNYMMKLKEDDVRYAEYLEKRRIYYNTVIKPKKQYEIILKNAIEELPPTVM